MRNFCVCDREKKERAVGCGEEGSSGKVTSYCASFPSKYLSETLCREKRRREWENLRRVTKGLGLWAWLLI